VREVWPKNLPLTARFGVVEYDGRDDVTLNESIELTRTLRRKGLDLMSVSVGFVTPWLNDVLKRKAHNVIAARF